MATGASHPTPEPQHSAALHSDWFLNTNPKPSFRKSHARLRLEDQDALVKRGHRRLSEHGGRRACLGRRAFRARSGLWLSRAILGMAPGVEGGAIPPEGPSRVRDAVGVGAVAPQQEEAAEALVLGEGRIARGEAGLERGLLSRLRAPGAGEGERAAM